MRSIEFGYVLHRRRDVPIIPVGLRTGGKWKEVWAYVDSGSFYTIFEDKIDEILDIEPTRQSRNQIEYCRLNIEYCRFNVTING